MTTKEQNIANNARNLEATQLVSLDDLQELEHLQLAHAPEPAQPRRTISALGTVSLILAAALLAVILMRAGGHF